MAFLQGRATVGWTILLLGLGLPLPAQVAPTCTALLQAQDVKAVAACKQQVDEADKTPPSEHMARIVANDNYGVALLAVAHKPSPALDAFNRAISLLPLSTVKPDSLQWAVTFWHRATAYQQLMQWDHAASDLSTAESSFAHAITAATGNQSMAQHFTQLRQRVIAQHADMLQRLGRRSEAQKLLATQ